jgi:hypothetical protein
VVAPVLWTVNSLIDPDSEIGCNLAIFSVNVVFETAASRYCSVGYKVDGCKIVLIRPTSFRGLAVLCFCHK